MRQISHSLCYKISMAHMTTDCANVPIELQSLCAHLRMVHYHASEACLAGNQSTLALHPAYRELCSGNPAAQESLRLGSRYSVEVRLGAAWPPPIRCILPKTTSLEWPYLPVEMVEYVAHVISATNSELFTCSSERQFAVFASEN